MLTRPILFLIDRYFRLWIRNKPILDKEAIFPESQEFERDWLKIRAEVESYLLQKWRQVPEFSQVDARQYEIANKDGHKWKTAILKMYGEYVNEAISPTLAALVRKHDRLVSSAIISCMEAGKEVPTHKGPNKSIMRFHLPLMVSEGECFLIVDNQRIDLQEGKGILWDDAYPHSVFNYTKTTRVALLLDVKRKLPSHLDKIYDFLLKKLRQTGEFQQAVGRARVD